MDWDYTEAARCYHGRPGYAEDLLDAVVAGVAPGTRVCDVGAGTGTLAAELARRGLSVIAVEPNAAMRACGLRRHDVPPMPWVAGVGEALPLADRAVGLVTFGSSFNVVDRARALAEAARVLVRHGRILCLWNFRCLDDPLQVRIESLIRASVPGYAPGTRREDQRRAIEASGRFHHIARLDRAVTHEVAADAWVDAFGAHVTLRRQAGSRLAEILTRIRREVARLGTSTVRVPYVTRAWLAERR